MTVPVVEVHCHHFNADDLPAPGLVAMHHIGDPDFDPAHKPEYHEGFPFSANLALLEERGLRQELGAR